MGENRPDANLRGKDDPLVQAYFARRPNLVRFFAARVGHRAAEDLAQDLYLKVAGRPEAGDADNPAALLYRIATNLMLDRSRGDQRSAAREAAWRHTAHQTLGGEDVADEPSADEATASRQRLRQLVAAVAELPPQMQRAFRLHKLEGKSQAETAEIMGVSRKMVEQHIQAAVRNLTQRLRT